MELRWQKQSNKTVSVVSEVNVINDFRFPGQYHDRESMLYYNWNRYYMPSVGRYNTVDPLITISEYIYVTNNPTKFVDATGLIKWSGYITVGTIAGGIGGFGGRATLTSECSAGYRVKATYTLAGVCISLGAKFTLVRFSVTFEDYESNGVPDPRRLEPTFVMSGGGITGGMGIGGGSIYILHVPGLGGGVGASVIKMGTAYSTGIVGWELGYDYSFFSVLGSSSLVKSERECCSQ